MAQTGPPQWEKGVRLREIIAVWRRQRVTRLSFVNQIRVAASAHPVESRGMRRPSRIERDTALHILKTADQGCRPLAADERELLSRFALAHMMDACVDEADIARARIIMEEYAVEARYRLRLPVPIGRGGARRSPKRRLVAMGMASVTCAALAATLMVSGGRAAKPLQQAAAVDHDTNPPKGCAAGGDTTAKFASPGVVETARGTGRCAVGRIIPTASVVLSH
jgi:hypothetical protein